MHTNPIVIKLKIFVRRLLVALMIAILVVACTPSAQDALPSGGGSSSSGDPTPTTETDTDSNRTDTGQDASSPDTGGETSSSGSGELLLLVNPGNARLVRYAVDGATQSDIYTFTPGGFATGAAGSPDGRLAAISYLPAAGETDLPSNAMGIFILPLDGSGGLEVFVRPGQENESVFHPEWSPDGQYVYFSRYIGFTDGTSKFTIERAAYPSGEVEVLVADAYWQKVSPDGSQLAYIKVSQVDGQERDELYVADITGANPRPVIQLDGFTTVDAPAWSPDGSMLIFSLPDELSPTSSLSWLDKLTGVRVAKAHDVPSDWWSVDVATGQPTRLTNLLTTSLYGHFSPDGNRIASVFALGLIIMNADGSDSQFIQLDGLPYGTVDWLP